MDDHDGIGHGDLATDLHRRDVGDERLVQLAEGVACRPAPRGPRGGSSVAPTVATLSASGAGRRTLDADARTVAGDDESAARAQCLGHGNAACQGGPGRLRPGRRRCRRVGVEIEGIDAAVAPYFLRLGRKARGAEALPRVGASPCEPRRAGQQPRTRRR